jgi:hypothetical protein
MESQKLKNTGYMQQAEDATMPYFFMSRRLRAISKPSSHKAGISTNGFPQRDSQG